MQSTVEVVSGLQRRVNLSVPLSDIEKEVGLRLKRLARTAKMPGFRPGKVPLAMLSKTYGPGIQNEVLNEKLGQAFDAVVTSSQLRVAGAPKVEPLNHPENSAPSVELNQIDFTATFEVYPEIVWTPLAEVQINKASTAVAEAEIDKTLEVLRKQRIQYEARENRAASINDQITVDFTGTLEGVAFEGGTAQGFKFVVGGGQMLAEFDQAVQGLKAGDSKVFPLTFPVEYSASNLAGKTVEFTVKVVLVEEPVLPEIDSTFIRSLGIDDGTVETLRKEIQNNLQREIENRLRIRNRDSAFDALIKASQFEVPTALINPELNRLAQEAREHLKERGVPNAASLPIPPEMFKTQAERRVRVGLIVADLINRADIQPKPDQVKYKIEQMAKGYDSPEMFIRWYQSNPDKLQAIEQSVLEDNTVDWTFSQAQVIELAVPFDELMGITS